MDGVQGAVSSRISGAQLDVTNAQGAEIVLSSGRTTNSAGGYSLVFSEFAIQEGILAPLIVTADGSLAEATCDFDGEGDFDCLGAVRSFAAFGTTYTLPPGYVFRGLSDSFPPENGGVDRTVTVNISAASDLAAGYALAAAAGSALTASDVQLASSQALGVVEFVTGLSTNGVPINDIPIIDLTNPDSGSTGSLAVALYGSSLNGQVDIENAALASYQQVLAQQTSNIMPEKTADTKADTLI